MKKQNKTNKGDTPFNTKQLKFAELLIDPEDRRNRREKIAEVGVAPSTAYRWLKDPEYLEFLDRQIDIVSYGHLATAWTSLITEVKKGDTPAIKLFFELKGKYKQLHEHTGKNGAPIETLNTNIDLDELTTEELEKLEEIITKATQNKEE